ncbi:hypothetical protein K3725_21670 (plasmid) [Leisingera sp. S132]|uniref:hypothetical protein n=1 Tax=Leisingera sp. S132 TaxID=2867016 RepID=UPI0021A3B3C6|nr:hypothetical protein [Leisingera sp. S132]UWQ81701.1 hypothetical protein K3725_21670 [Leisingera sp. S132]
MFDLPGPTNNSGGSFTSLQLSQALTEQSQALSYGRTVRSKQLYQDIKNKLDIYTMEASKFQAERAMANQESQRVMSSLAGKFSLISKIQQSMG